MDKKIIHVDMDCFFAAIEMQENPDLRSRPMAVGGSAQGRGVLCTANYEARKYGVKSAMPTAFAKKLCPDLVVVSPRSERYCEVSRHIQDIFYRYTDIVEPLSLDEAFLDVTNSRKYCGSASLLAREIRQVIWEETGLSASAGVSLNKFLAKVASDWNKPNGLFVVAPTFVDTFMQGLNVDRIPGVGKVTASKLAQMNIKTCADLQKLSSAQLILHFGKMGEILYQRARGIDYREVSPSRVRKSLSVERTFAVDKNLEELELEILELEGKLIQRLQNLRNKSDNRYEVKQLFVKLKFSDFQTVTCEEKKESSFLWPLNDLGVMNLSIRDFLINMIRATYAKNDKKVRLLGIGVRFACAKSICGGQLELFECA